ncbi:uncharacterized protein VDAG_02800 [Verticillium dahliae VdLs.17]|uniref:Amine oxidase domain-containing protein n=2 Tax=Verticillium dahliae TaxID=27337 RepID=G2WX21_VERDV|nr:uncharacterized protein VDAG_02800 [Verticillium dahliae VdLs.17]EGY21276.1 hypothetical protein VDAG_02800 [Verticillium dahliae VdLs.17]KAF3351260.1 G-patch domain-containing protein [Verticillium dahliae VDG2]KAH6707269.1 hypothetical protein EV126DRAFT_356901 [Verticillium dahliae]PNH30284.1 hypothetical protein BJF96_g6316 [Verticillium dahliae]
MHPPTSRPPDKRPPIRVAIIGTGLAGLTTAHLLQSDDQNRYAVTLFEQANGLSFDSASVAVRNEATATVERIDLPMRASAGGYYDNLMRMYTHLGVPLHPVRFLFVFARALADSTAAAVAISASGDRTQKQPPVGAAPGTYFVHASNLHQTPPPRPARQSLLRHLVEILFLIVCQLWFSLACFLVQPKEASTTPGTSSTAESLDDYLRRICIPRRYITHYLLPLMASVSTCSHDDMLAFPASDVVSYKCRSHGQQHFAVCGGVSQVQGRLVRGINDVRLSTRVLAIEPRAEREAVLVRSQKLGGTGRGEEEAQEDEFDRVVLAVSPDVAGRLFKPLRSAVERIPVRQVESSILTHAAGAGGAPAHTVVDGYQGVRACMHHDEGEVSPSQVITLRTAFSKMGADSEALHAMPSGVVVSTCPLNAAADAKRTLHTARFTRTLRTTKSRAVVEQIMGRSRLHKKKTDGIQSAWVSGEDNVWLAGAWCWDGMVLLEGCVVSAMAIANDFGVRIPWR